MAACRMKMMVLIGARFEGCAESGPTLVAPFEADGHPDHRSRGHGMP